jgi:hypothetical protein
VDAIVVPELTIHNHPSEGNLGIARAGPRNTPYQLEVKDFDSSGLEQINITVYGKDDEPLQPPRTAKVKIKWPSRLGSFGER